MDEDNTWPICWAGMEIPDGSAADAGCNWKFPRRFKPYQTLHQYHQFGWCWGYITTLKNYIYIYIYTYNISYIYVYQLPMVEVIPFYFICPIISSVHFRGVRWAWHRSSMTAATRIWSVRAHGELTWLWWITSISRYIIELNGPCSIAFLNNSPIFTNIMMMIGSMIH